MKTRMILLITALFCLAAFAATDAQKAENAALKAAKILGWPQSTVIPEDAPGSAYLISSDGKGDDSEIRGYVTASGNPLEIAYNYQILDLFGMEKTKYQGRDARVFKAGKDCNPTGLTKALNEMFVGWIESIFGESDDPDKNCVTLHGTIVWSCRNYMFMATDETDEGGNEADVAAALYAAAQEEGLCDYGDTLVILAQAGNKPGSKKIAEFEKIAQKTNEYYAKNSYGKEAFTYTFLDADGSAGNNDWYTVGASQAGFDHQGYAEAAVKKAFAGTSMPQDLTFKRIIVVYSGSSKQADSANGVFSTADQWGDNSYSIEVAGSDRVAKVYTTDLIIVAENDEMGLWAHEIGHSIYSKYAVYDKWNHVADRYNYVDAWGQHGTIGSWGLMGTGNWWGTPLATNPVQMSSFTKESAGWLSYADIKLNETYTATAIESKKLGDTTYRLDDPESNDAKSYYLIEARDSSGTYSAPESGTVMYKVSYDGTNKHYVVNMIGPQTGLTEKNDTTKFEYPYGRATLHGAGAPDGATIYRNVPGKFRITLETETSAPYTSTFKVEEYIPRSLVGAALNPGRPLVAPPSGVVITANSLGPMPDLDLHAYDDRGGHVGLDYQTWQYENTISDAVASGDLKDDQEWIYVPEGTNVRFEVSSYKTQQFLARNPSFASSAKPQEYASTLLKVDSQGRQFEADGGSGSIGNGQTAQLKSPSDASLTYSEKNNPGFVGNSVCPLMPFIALFLLGMFAAKRIRLV
ncbi:MAG: hypothetical protein WC488_03660 [Candidatus Micrarchaeia archaeon]